jgi:hypothetical protein
MPLWLLQMARIPLSIDTPSAAISPPAPSPNTGGLFAGPWHVKNWLWMRRQWFTVFYLYFATFITGTAGMNAMPGCESVDGHCDIPFITVSSVQSPTALYNPGSVIRPSFLYSHVKLTKLLIPVHGGKLEKKCGEGFTVVWWQSPSNSTGFIGEKVRWRVHSRLMAVAVQLYWFYWRKSAVKGSQSSDGSRRATLLVLLEKKCGEGFTVVWWQSPSNSTGRKSAVKGSQSSDDSRRATLLGEKVRWRVHSRLMQSPCNSTGRKSAVKGSQSSDAVAVQLYWFYHLRVQPPPHDGHESKNLF